MPWGPCNKPPPPPPLPQLGAHIGKRAESRAAFVAAGHYFFLLFFLVTANEHRPSLPPLPRLLLNSKADLPQLIH